MTRRWSSRPVAGVLAGCIALSGCSEEERANDSLPTTADASPTEEELPPLGPEDLPMPEEARTQDAAGAEAFVRYYVELINRTSDVMDAEPLRQFSDGCKECDRIADNIEADATAGLHYDGGTITISAVGEPLLTDDTAEIALRADQAALSVSNSAGAPTDGGSVAYRDLSGGVSLHWSSEQRTWVITGLTLE